MLLLRERCARRSSLLHQLSISIHPREEMSKVSVAKLLWLRGIVLETVYYRGLFLYSCAEYCNIHILNFYIAVNKRPLIVR